MPWGLLLAIAVGGALGSLARYFLSSGIYSVTGTAFPWGILIVNVLGGFLMGLAETMVVGYLSSTYRDALAFVLLIIILLVKPTGLLGKKLREKV